MSDSILNLDNGRRYFRLRLPKDAWLPALIGDRECWVTEIAEKSLKVTTDWSTRPGSVVTGMFQWSDGSPCVFEGVFGPLRHRERLILEVCGISMRDVVLEQRALLARFPCLTGNDRPHGWAVRQENPLS